MQPARSFINICQSGGEMITEYREQNQPKLPYIQLLCKLEHM